jgi:DNA-binding LytR/AlgR family response regulator
MKVVIIEDETAAEVNLRALLAGVCPEAQVVASLESVTDTVAWFSANPAPDLVFMDIHLADGDAFRIFPQIEIASPIVFTTAYDQYALEAFKVNSIDYLLKPIKPDELRRALDKLDRLSGSERTEYADKVKTMAAAAGRTFLVHMRDKIVPLSLDRIAFCYTENERVSAHTVDGRQMPLDGALDHLMARLPEDEFFRANRQFIVARRAVKDISVWFGSRLSLDLTQPTPERIVISKARVPEFKRWIRGGEGRTAFAAAVSDKNRK